MTNVSSTVTRCSGWSRLHARVIACCLLAAGTLACDPTASVELRNDSHDMLLIGSRLDHRYVIEPGESQEIPAIFEGGAFFCVFDERNSFIAEIDLPWEELKAMEFRYTITQAELEELIARHARPTTVICGAPQEEVSFD